MDTQCVHCGALHWIEEKRQRSSAAYPTFGCCMDGEVQLARRYDFPGELLDLFDSVERQHDGRVRRTKRCAEIQRTIRHLNNAFSFCSLGGEVDDAVLNGRGNNGSYTFRLHGQMYHRLGSLQPREGDKPAFAQLYIFDGAEEQLQRRGEAFTSLDPNALRTVQHVLTE
jgi:hypothetical protein